MHFQPHMSFRVSVFPRCLLPHVLSAAGEISRSPSWKAEIEACHFLFGSSLICIWRVAQFGHNFANLAFEHADRIKLTDADENYLRFN